MAVTTGIFVQILLVIFLRREKIVERFKFHCQRFPGLAFLRRINRFDLVELCIL